MQVGEGRQGTVGGGSTPGPRLPDTVSALHLAEARPSTAARATGLCGGRRLTGHSVPGGRLQHPRPRVLRKQYSENDRDPSESDEHEEGSGVAAGACLNRTHGVWGQRQSRARDREGQTLPMSAALA